MVLVDGELVWFLERGGKSLLSFGAGPAASTVASEALVASVRDGRVGPLLVERIDGVPALEAHRDASAAALVDAGFARTPRGLRLRG